MRITIIGSGNVATHFAAAFKNAGHRIIQVYSRDMHKAALLAYHAGAAPIDSLENTDPATDIFIIAVKDDAILQVTEGLAKFGKLIAHTSGATNLQSLLGFTVKAGVLYPLQTLSKSIEIDFNTVPICIEGAGEAITALLEQLAATVSTKVYRVNSEQRRILHLAAVFACNFPNYLYTAAQRLLEQNQIDFDLLRPLIKETAEKVQKNLPADVQTGPAVRGDELTMAAHLGLLKGEQGLQKVYDLLSQEIIKNKDAGQGRK